MIGYACFIARVAQQQQSTINKLKIKSTLAEIELMKFRMEFHCSLPVGHTIAYSIMFD